VSRDQTQADFDSYFSEMPWMALPFSDRVRAKQIAQELGVAGIPSLVLLDCQGKVIHSQGREVVLGDPSGSWIPQPIASAEPIQPAAMGATEPRIAMFAVGCFWMLQLAMQRTDGVISSAVGYAMGQDPEPSYADVCQAGPNGHAEVVQVEYDSNVVTYQQLVRVFFDSNEHDRGAFNQRRLINRR